MAEYTSTEVGAPSRGTYKVDDRVTDANGVVFVCVKGGQASLPGAGSEGAAVFVAFSGASLAKQAAPVAKTTSVTLTAAELLNGIITGNQGAAGAAAYTLPLAADLETELLSRYPGLSNDDAFDFNVINLSTVAAEDITITTNTGWTLVGSMLVIEQAAANPGGSNGRFRARRTGAGAYSLYRIS